MIDGRMWARSAALGSGGELWLTADKDVTVNAALNAGGGDFDGGFIDIIAGEVATINANVKANSAWGAGTGGLIGVDARSIEIARGTKILANGHHGPDFGGDGGEIGFVANHFVSHEDTVISARGAGPDGYGGFVDIEVYDDAVVSSIIRATGFGGGGLMLFTAEGSFTLTEGARIDGDARKGSSTEMYISRDTRLEVNGRISTSSGPAASRGGSANVLTLDSNGDIHIGGRIDMKGSAGSFFPRRLAINGCNITLADGARVRNSGDPGEVELVGRELIHVEPAASVRAHRGNVSVRFVHRDGGPIPVIEGRVQPAPLVEADSSLTACTP